MSRKNRIRDKIELEWSKGMPNLKSAKKRMRVSERQREENKVYRTRVRTARRKFDEAVTSKDVNVVREAFSNYCSMLDKAAKHNIIAKNTAIRSKSRASAKVRALAA